MSKKYAIFLSALFCAFLGVFLAANALSPDREFSQMENRYLQQLPAPSLKTVLDGSFMSGFETYVTDQFVGRDGWISVKSRTERLLGKRENNGVYFCQGDALITRFDSPDPKRVADNLGYVQRFAEKAPAPVYFSLIPTQACIWADKLPEGAPNYDQRDVLSTVSQQLSGKVTLADRMWAILSAHKDEPIFYRTDHHWTSLGAYYGYTSLMWDMSRDGEIVPLENYVKTTVSTEFYGTVFSSSGVRWVKPDEIDIYVPEDGVTVTSHTYDSKGQPVEEPRQLYDESYLAKKDKYSMFLGGQQSLGVVRTGNTDKPKLLLIRDSYSDSLVPFLTPHFSEIHLVDLRYNKQSTTQYIKDNGIDLAVVLYSVPNFVSDSNLVWLGR